MLIIAFTIPGYAQFTCDVGSLAGDCTVNTAQSVTGDTTVVGNLTIDAAGSLDYGDGTAEINVGGNMQVNGSISAKGDNGGNGAGGTNNGSGSTINGGNGDPGDDGGHLTFNVDGNVVISDTGSITANGSKGGNGGGGGNRTGGMGGTTGNGGNGGDGGDNGNGGSLTFNVCGDFTVEANDTDGTIEANGATGGKGSGGGIGRGSGNQGGDGGDSKDGGPGGPIVINADGTITIGGVVHAHGGNGLPGGNAGNGIAGAGNGNAGTDGNDGSDGSITINTPQTSVDTTGADIDPTATINLEQASICDGEVVVFCTVSHGCMGQPGGDLGGGIALCNDPLAGWLTLNQDDVLPMTVGGAHTITTCSVMSYNDPSHDGQGSGANFQTMCNQDGVKAYLPAGSSPGVLSSAAGSNREISGQSDMQASDISGSGSGGSGGGTLTGQALALKLGLAIGNTGNGPSIPAAPGTCSGGFCVGNTGNPGDSCSGDDECYDTVDFVPRDLGGYTLPGDTPVELCTQTSGGDLMLEADGICGAAICDTGFCSGNSVNAGAACVDNSGCIASDDVCQMFTFPDCVAGQTVSQILTAAENVLSGGAESLCNGTASTLNGALDKINNAFDGCGKVIDCLLVPAP